MHQNAALTELMYVADEMEAACASPEELDLADRQERKILPMFAWPIVNSVISIAFRGHGEAYITDMPTYRKKIQETIKYGGDQLLLQGGHHPQLGLDFYTGTFRAIKAEFPDIRLHALARLK